jgi:hypothetical protein
MFQRIVFWFVFFIFIPSFAAADSDLFAELQVTSYVSRSDSGYTGKQLYVEKDLGESDTAVFGMVYHDEAFKEVQIGLAKHLTEGVQVGIGVGEARYDEESHHVISPWVYYTHEDIEAVLLAEFYSNDSSHFVKGYLHKGVTRQLSVGLYGETDLGVGPLVTYQLTDSLKVWGAVPIVDRGDVMMVIGVVVEF